MAAYKKLLYVGNLDESITKEILQSVFIPFGDIVQVKLVMDEKTQKHKGYGFVEFEEAEDAKAAILNMNFAELNGNPMTINFATAMHSAQEYNSGVWNLEDTFKAQHETLEQFEKAQDDSNQTNLFHLSEDATIQELDGIPPNKKQKL